MEIWKISSVTVQSANTEGGGVYGVAAASHQGAAKMQPSLEDLKVHFSTVRRMNGTAFRFDAGQHKAAHLHLREQAATPPQRDESQR